MTTQAFSSSATVNVCAEDGKVRLSITADHEQVEVAALFTPHEARRLMNAFATECVEAGRQEVDARDRAQHGR